VLVVANLLVFAGLWMVLELGARLLFPRDLEAVFDNPRVFRHNRPYVQDDAQRGFALRPGYSTPRMTVTRDGFRANAPERQDSAWAAHRIVCLGGSTTFGWGLADHESYPAQLEIQLQDVFDAPISVINAGVPSYTSAQVDLTLDTILDMQPQLVIVMSMWNDLLFSFVDNWYPDLLVHQRPTPARRFLLRHSAVARAVFLRDPDTTLECRSSPEAQQHYQTNLQHIVDACRERDVRLLFVLPPLQEDRIPEEGMRIGRQTVPRDVFLAAADAFTAVLEDVARVNDVPLVRHRVCREAQPDAQLFLDAAHPQAEGYRLLAEDVGATILRHDLMGVALVVDH
jgi:lysophospholipase L1-like esterase